MKTVVIDGVEYEEVRREGSFLEGWLLAYQPLPPKPKTIVQVAAEAGGESENKYSNAHPERWKVYDAIEQRLQAIERKLEGK